MMCPNLTFGEAILTRMAKYVFLEKVNHF